MPLLIVTFSLQSIDLQIFLDFLIEQQNLAFKTHVFKQLYATGDRYVLDVIIEFDDWNCTENVADFLQNNNIDYMSKRIRMSN